jgi:uncharacterized membrane protein
MGNYIKMVNNNKEYPFVFVGLLILFVGWFSIFTGFAGIILAEDFEFFIEVEDFILIKQVIPAEHIIFHMAVRIAIGFLLVFIGNSFLLASKSVNERYCRPCFDDVRKLK